MGSEALFLSLLDREVFLIDRKMGTWVLLLMVALMAKHGFIGQNRGGVSGASRNGALHGKHVSVQVQVSSLLTIDHRLPVK